MEHLRDQWRKTASMKDRAYRGVPLKLDAGQGVPILQALVKGQRNVADLSRPVTAARKPRRFSDFERGMRVQVRGSQGTVVKIRGQGNVYTKGYVQILFDEFPGLPAWYPWREVEIVEGS